MSPSPYFKKGYGEVSKKAEDRIREDIIVKCKVCGGIMKFYNVELMDTYIESSGQKNYYYCAICLRKVVITQL